MRNKTRRALWGFFSLDYKAMEDYLEEMAKKGWMLEKIGRFTAKFRAIEPQKLKFYVDVFKKGGILTSENNEEIVEYRKLCQESGWTFITSQELMIRHPLWLHGITAAGFILSMVWMPAEKYEF